MFEMFAAVNSINASNLLSVKRHLSGWNFCPATLKTRSLVISKLLTIFFQTAGYDVFSCVMAFGSFASAAWDFSFFI